MQHVPEISRWEREAHYWAFLFPIQDASGNERFSICVFKCSCRWWINQPLETPCAALASFLLQAQPPISFEYWVIKSNCSAHWGFPSLKKMREIKTRYGLALVREYHFSAAYLRQRKEKRKERGRKPRLQQTEHRDPLRPPEVGTRRTGRGASATALFGHSGLWPETPNFCPSRLENWHENILLEKNRWILEASQQSGLLKAILQKGARWHPG